MSRIIVDLEEHKKNVHNFSKATLQGSYLFDTKKNRATTYRGGKDTNENNYTSFNAKEKRLIQPPYQSEKD